MKKEILLVLFLSTIYSNAFSQFDLGIKANAGIGKVTVFPGYYAKFKCAPTGQFGIFSKYQFKNKTYIGTELLFLQIGERVINYAPDIRAKFYINSLSIALPIYYGIRFNHISFNVGGQPSFDLFSIGKAKGQEMGSNGWTNLKRSPYLLLPNRPFHLGVRVAVLYILSDKISVEGLCYYDKRDDLVNPSTQYYRHIRTKYFVLGLHFLVNSKKNGKDNKK